MTREPRRYGWLAAALERGLLPDWLLRAGSLYGAWHRERGESAGGVAAQQAAGAGGPDVDRAGGRAGGEGQ